MSKFQIRFEKERDRVADFGWTLSITHNGYQWTSVSFTLDEALRVAIEIIRVASNYIIHLEAGRGNNNAICICAELLNGTPDAVVNPDCPVHGGLHNR